MNIAKIIIFLKAEMQPNIIKAGGIHKVAGYPPLKQHQLGNSFHFFQYLKKKYSNNNKFKLLNSS